MHGRCCLCLGCICSCLSCSCSARGPADPIKGGILHKITITAQEQRLLLLLLQGLNIRLQELLLLNAGVRKVNISHQEVMATPTQGG